jgi:Mg-chelatase subunit ChlD
MRRSVAWMALSLAACGAEEGQGLDPFRAPPPPPRPGCRTTDVVAIPVGEGAGYARFDEALAAGRVPAAHEVEPNQAFAERSLDIEGACCDGDLCVTASMAAVPSLATPGPQAVLQISLVTGLRAQERPPAGRTLVVAVDASGSLLSRQRIGFVKDALHAFISEVEDEAQLGIVAFDAQPWVLVPTGGAAAVRATAHAAVDALAPGGGTDLATGLVAAFTEASRVFDSSREHRVLLLTDGNDPQAQLESDALSHRLRPFLMQGILLTVFGVGDDGDQGWLRTVTLGADGRFVADEGGAGLAGLVMEELGRRYVPVATDLEVRVRPPDAARFGAEAGWTPPIRADGLLRAELSAVLLGPDGELVTPGQGTEAGPALVVDLVPIPAEGQAGADVVLNFVPVGSGARETYRATVALPEAWPDLPASGDTRSPAAREALFARHLGEALTEAVALWSGGQRVEALRRVLVLEAVAGDYPEGDADVARDQLRVNQLRRRMEGQITTRPEVELPADPWPGP